MYIIPPRCPRRRPTDQGIFVRVSSLCADAEEQMKIHIEYAAPKHPILVTSRWSPILPIVEAPKGKKKPKDLTKESEGSSNLPPLYFFSSIPKYSDPGKYVSYTLSTLELIIGLPCEEALDNRFSVMVTSLPFLAFRNSGRLSTES